MFKVTVKNQESSLFNKTLEVSDSRRGEFYCLVDGVIVPINHKDAEVYTPTKIQIIDKDSPAFGAILKVKRINNYGTYYCENPEPRRINEFLLSSMDVREI